MNTVIFMSASGTSSPGSHAHSAACSLHPLTAEMNAHFAAHQYAEAAQIALSITTLSKDEFRDMSTPRTIDEVMRDMNAWALAEGIAFHGDPWSIPPVEGSILDISPTPEAEARIARLRARRLAHAESAKRASEQARQAQDNPRTHNGEQRPQTATQDERAHLSANEEPKPEVTGRSPLDT